MPAKIVSACWAIFAVTWVVAALFVKRTVERSWVAGRWLFIGLAVIVWLLLQGPAPFAGGRLWPRSATLDWAAAALALIGLVVTLWARAALGRNWSGAVTFKQDHELTLIPFVL